MAAEATLHHHSGEVKFVTTGALASGEVIQLADGRAGIVAGLRGFLAGEVAVAYTEGVFTVAKTATMVLLKGGRLFWKRSTNAAHFAKGNDDFYLGSVYADAASADTTCRVDLNQIQRCNWSSKEVLGVTALVGTTTTLISLPGAGAKANLLATSEAQKADLLSDVGVTPAYGPILEARIDIEAYGTGDVDVNIGLANATHASDADSITESAFIHIDGGSLNILAESDDGTTEVVATDTTLDYVQGTYFEVWIDARDLTSVKMYVNGVRVLAATTFVLTLATGPLKALLHVEKSTGTATGEVRIERLVLRAASL